MEIRTSEFTLRHPKISDLEEYWRNKNDKLIAKNYVFFSYPYSKSNAKKDLIEMIKDNKKKNKTKEFFLVELNGKVVGEIGLGEIIPNLKAKTHSWIGKEYRGRGIMTRVRKVFIKYAFKQYNLRRIYALTRTHNKSSARVLEKSGFKLEGKIKNDVLKDGKYYDSYLYALTK